MAPKKKVAVKPVKKVVSKKSLVIKAKKPAAKGIAKPAASKASKKAVVGMNWTRVQTAEGWKRGMHKKLKAKNT